MNRNTNKTKISLAAYTIASMVAIGAIITSPTTTMAAPLDDLVSIVPDFGRPPTPQFSGYLDGSKGCDTSVNGPECKLHYTLALAEHDGKTIGDITTNNSPVVLWLNGGPGSSSLLGWYTELGPLLMNATGGLMENPWSWTKAGVNLLAIEAPMGVGFSYCSRQINDKKPCVNSDQSTAKVSRAALVDFFTNKFPELNGDFYITGESYAGVYIPTLAKELLEDPAAKDAVPLKGIAVGDPCTDDTLQNQSMDKLWYSNKYGLVDSEIYDLLTSDECEEYTTSMNEGYESSTMKNEEPKNRYLRHRRNLNDSTTDKKCVVALRKYKMSSTKVIDFYNLFGPITSREAEQMGAYLNRPDVRKALNVDTAPLEKWHASGNENKVGFNYTREYHACNLNSDSDIAFPNVSMVDFYKEIVPRLDRTWIYSGDADPAVPYEGTREAVKQIMQPELDGGGYRPWYYNQSSTGLDILSEKALSFGPDLYAAPDLEYAQFGGEVVNYEEGLLFATFHGAGHMVPQFRPQAALHFIKTFIGSYTHGAVFEDKKDASVASSFLLSPLLPSNSTLEKLNDTEFVSAMNNWTNLAKGPSYVSE